MALGWKALIPISLVWIMTVAIVRAMRTQGYPGWAAVLLVVGVVAVALIGQRVWHTLRRRRIQSERTPTVTGPFPVPPLPAKEVTNVR